MKNKIKKIIPLILCFVMIAGSCLTVNASTNSAGFNSNYDKYVFQIKNNTQVRVHLNSSNAGSGYVEESILTFSNIDEDKPVYMYLYSTDTTNHHVTGILFSKYDTSISYNLRKIYSSGAEWKENANEDITVSTNSFSSVNGFYYATMQLTIWGTKTLGDIIPSHPLIINSLSYSNFFKDKMSTDAAFDSEIVVPDGFGELTYSTSPTAEIEPPQNLSIYRGYSNADKQYKFQMQWNKPADTDLNVEVMYNVHWKEGTGSALGFGTHVYKKYQHLVYDDGHSAQTNKLQYLEDDLLKGYFELQNMDVPSVYNIDEIYVRFAKEIDGVIHYSLWRKIDYMNLDEGNGFDSTEDDFQAESSTGAFDTSDNWIDQSVQNGEIVNGSEKEDAKAPGLDANGDNITNVDKPIVNPDSWDGQFEGVFSQFTNAIKSAFSFVGEFPSMLSEFFGFLPASVIGSISIGLIMVVVLRFLGR